MGCLVEERFSDPILVEARENGLTVALALFNRRGRTLYLSESGNPALDCVYIEYNGVLAETGREVALTADCLLAARGAAAGRLNIPHLGVRHLILSGVSIETVLSAAMAGHVLIKRSLRAPVAELSRQEACYLEGRSRNTRQQLRRSNRSYDATLGIRRAGSLKDAHEFLNGLAQLHQVSWIARGQLGAFANPFFARFHHSLVARGFDRQEIDLFRIDADSRAIGFLYNFQFQGCSIAYQSGFDYRGATPQGKPGLTCHYAALQRALESGADRYLFLAGCNRYKGSLSDRADTLHWIEFGTRYSPHFAGKQIIAAVRRWSF